MLSLSPSLHLHCSTIFINNTIFPSVYLDVVREAYTQEEGACVYFIKDQMTQLLREPFDKKHLTILNPHLQGGLVGPPGGLGGKGCRSDARRLLARDRNIVPLHCWTQSKGGSTLQKAGTGAAGTQTELFLNDWK